MRDCVYYVTLSYLNERLCLLCHIVILNERLCLLCHIVILNGSSNRELRDQNFKSHLLLRVVVYYFSYFILIYKTINKMWYNYKHLW